MVRGRKLPFVTIQKWVYQNVGTAQSIHSTEYLPVYRDGLKVGIHSWAATIASRGDRADVDVDVVDERTTR